MWQCEVQILIFVFMLAFACIHVTSSHTSSLRNSSKYYDVFFNLSINCSFVVINPYLAFKLLSSETVASNMQQDSMLKTSMWLLFRICAVTYLKWQKYSSK
uniref:Uncharacterized protein n=1 Tax=Rhipicephalus microplus TaxID=6941 RepID=A0A6M2DAH9_RHIMP